MVVVAEATATKRKWLPLPSHTSCTPSLSALLAVPAAVVLDVSALSLFILFSSSPTLKAIPCGFPTPYRGTRYRICGAGACPVVVTRTALSLSGDKERVTQVPCYYRVKDIWPEPVGAPCRSVSMTECPKQRRSSDRHFEDRCYILRL